MQPQKAAPLSNLRFGFLMGTEGGLMTDYLNLKAGLTPDLGIVSEWIINESWQAGGRIERLPVVPHKIKAGVRLRLNTYRALANQSFDALFINNVVSLATLRSFPHFLSRQPYFVTSDATMKQLHTFGDIYKKHPSRLPAYERHKHRSMAKMLQNAAVLFPYSQWVAQSMIHDYGADPARVHVAVTGINLEQWTAAPRDQCGLTNILFIGGLFVRKGGNLLLEWARQTSAKDWILHLVTRDSITPPNENVRVHNGLTANSPALMELYRQAHFVVLPTLGDNYSLGAIEAIASGLPAIQSRTGGTEDIIREGETGYLVTPGNLEELSDRIEYLLANPQARETMGHAARRDAEARFDIRRNVPRMAAIMREAIGR